MAPNKVSTRTDVCHSLWGRIEDTFDGIIGTFHMEYINWNTLKNVANWRHRIENS